MKKLGVAVFLAWALFSFGCSSTPSGTDNIGDLTANGASRLGQKVVVVGVAETKTGQSSMGLFRVFNAGHNIWAWRNVEELDEPPQGEKVRVEGVLRQKEFNIIGKVFYVEASKISME